MQCLYNDTMSRSSELCLKFRENTQGQLCIQSFYTQLHLRLLTKTQFFYIKIIQLSFRHRQCFDLIVMVDLID